MTIIFLILSIALAQNCPDQAEDFGPYRFRRSQISKALGCMVNVKLRDSTDTKPARFFDFLKEGQIQITTQNGPVSKTDSTGTRSYFILPANETQSIKSLGGLGIQVKDSAGLGWSFNEQGEITSENGCKLKVNPKITWENESTANNKDGGFSINRCPGSIIIDVGFRRTRNPIDEKDRVIAIRDPQGKSCQVKNSEVFSYKDQGLLKYKRSEDFYAFLSKKPGCQDLDLSPLYAGNSTQKSNPQR